MEFFIIPVIVVGLILLFKTLVVINQYERGVVLTLGQYSYTLQPGLKILIPIIQKVITKDNVPVGINAVVYFQVVKPEDAVLKIQDFTYAITQYAQTALRDVIGGVELDTLLTERQKIADEIKALVDRETSGCGVDVTAIKIQDIELPADMKRAMAKQAEAERERR